MNYITLLKIHESLFTISASSVSNKLNGQALLLVALIILILIYIVLRTRRIKAEKAPRRIYARRSCADRWPVNDLIETQSTIDTIEHLVPSYSLLFIPSASMKSKDQFDNMITKEDPPPSYDEYLKDPRYRSDFEYC